MLLGMESQYLASKLMKDLCSLIVCQRVKTILDTRAEEIAPNTKRAVEDVNSENTAFEEEA